MGGDDEHANMEPLDRFVMNDVSSGNNSATDEASVSYSDLHIETYYYTNIRNHVRDLAFRARRKKGREIPKFITNTRFIVHRYTGQTSR